MGNFRDQPPRALLPPDPGGPKTAGPRTLELGANGGGHHPRHAPGLRPAEAKKQRFFKRNPFRSCRPSSEYAARCSRGNTLFVCKPLKKRAKFYLPEVVVVAASDCESDAGSLSFGASTGCFRSSARGFGSLALRPSATSRSLQSLTRQFLSGRQKIRCWIGRHHQKFIGCYEERDHEVILGFSWNRF